ncbi:transposase [Paraburkholderia bryophila]|uniref:transposase n=1 Tax=Paraburkholderia bryophila TaxID=420952 RepID=UPI00234A5371|nr:transposase [Paraburkholderia bryophila]WCM22551.1 transposase [Paraburkholderia bryophila]
MDLDFQSAAQSIDAREAMTEKAELSFVSLTDQQWLRVAQIIHVACYIEERRGRPRAGARCILDGILWVLQNRQPWGAMPDIYPSYKTCNRHFLKWTRIGLLPIVMHELFGTTELILQYGKRGRQRMPVGSGDANQRI